MYTILAILSIAVLVIGGILTCILASNQKTQKYKSKDSKRFVNLIWVYVLGLGVAVVLSVIFLSV